MNAGVGIGDVAGAAHGETVSHAVHRLGGGVFLALLCHFQRTDTGEGILGVDGVGLAHIVGRTGVGGQGAPTGGDHHAVAELALTVSHDVEGADRALHAQSERHALHHTGGEVGKLFAGVLRLLGVDDGVVHIGDRGVIHIESAADGAVQLKVAVGDLQLGAVVRHDGSTPASQIVAAVAVGHNGGAADGVLSAVLQQDAVKVGAACHEGDALGAVLIELAAHDGLGDRTIVHNFTAVHQQGLTEPIGGLLLFLSAGPRCSAGAAHAIDLHLTDGEAILHLVGAPCQKVTLDAVHHEDEGAAFSGGHGGGLTVHSVLGGGDGRGDGGGGIVVCDLRAEDGKLHAHIGKTPFKNARNAFYLHRHYSTKKGNFKGKPPFLPPFE